METATRSRKSSGPIKWMAHHPVSANLLMLVLLLGGLFAATRIKQEVFPDFELDMVRISVPYPGASPQEVERGILLAVEEAVQGIEGVKKVTSRASEGVGTVTVDMLEGEDIQRLAQEIKAEVDRIATLPGEAEEPKVTILARKRYVISLALYGNQSERVLREYGEFVRERLLQAPDITQAELTSVRNYEISVDISQDTLRAYGLTLSEVAEHIRRASVELPGGAIKSTGGDIMVRMKERRDYGPEFGQIPIIAGPDGTRVNLDELAVVRDTFEETDYQATYNGQPAVLIEVYRIGDQTPIAVSKAVKKVVAGLKPTLPPGLSIDQVNDRSEIYRQRLNLMLRNGGLGLILVFMLLALFLELRLAFWVSLGIPISLLGSLLFLPWGGISINIVSLFAFIVTIGIVVDDAIVVGENVYLQRQKGSRWITAAIEGARDIAVPVTFSVLTNMIAFVPMFFVPGFMGKIFSQIPVVVICVFTISLVESLLILPAHLGHQKEEHRPLTAFGGMLNRLQQRFSLLFMHAIDRWYRPALRWVLNWRYVTLGIGVAILILTLGYIRSGRLGFELFPKVESDYAKVTATLPIGSPFTKTLQTQKVLVARAQAVATQNGDGALVEGIFAHIFGNVTEVRVYLTPPDKRPISTSEFTGKWRANVGMLPGLESLRFESDAGGPGRGAPIAIEMRHQDMAALESAGQDLARALSFYPGILDVDDGFAPGKKQIDFQVRPEARSLGLRSMEIARQVRHAYYGAEALRQQRGRNEVRVMVRLPKEERGSRFSLEEMVLVTPAGGEILLRDAVDMQPGRAYTDINRREGRRIITVTADVRPRKRAGQILSDVKADILPQLEAKYPGLTCSFEGRQADRRESLESLFKGIGVVLIVIFGMLAVPLNSYIQPIIIMAAIPFGIVGAVLGHMIMGYALSVISMFGVLALIGVVINDSLVLIDMANRRRRKGLQAFAAILQAAPLRFRPILLTTLTTFGGLSPMIFETSRQARFLIPMAISLGFGVLVATFITLALVPAIYLIVEDVKGIVTKLGGRRIARSH